MKTAVIKRYAFISYALLGLGWLALIIWSRGTFVIPSGPSWIPEPLWVALYKGMHGLGGQCLSSFNDGAPCWSPALNRIPSLGQITLVMFVFLYLIEAGESLTSIRKQGKTLDWKRPLWIALVVLAPLLGSRLWSKRSRQEP